MMNPIANALRRIYVRHSGAHSDASAKLMTLPDKSSSGTHALHNPARRGSNQNIQNTNTKNSCYVTTGKKKEKHLNEEHLNKY